MEESSEKQSGFVSHSRSAPLKTQTAVATNQASCVLGAAPDKRSGSHQLQIIKNRIQQQSSFRRGNNTGAYSTIVL